MAQLTESSLCRRLGELQTQLLAAREQAAVSEEARRKGQARAGVEIQALQERLEHRVSRGLGGGGIGVESGDDVPTLL